MSETITKLAAAISRRVAMITDSHIIDMLDDELPLWMDMRQPEIAVKISCERWPNRSEYFIDGELKLTLYKPEIKSIEPMRVTVKHKRH